MSMKNLTAGLLGALMCLSCTKRDHAPPIEEGQVLYKQHCTQCHHNNPRLDSIGPALAGVTWNVLETKVYYGAYPLGYVPKRTTNNMPRMTYITEQQLIDIYNYLWR